MTAAVFIFGFISVLALIFAIAAFVVQDSAKFDVSILEANVDLLNVKLKYLQDAIATLKQDAEDEKYRPIDPNSRLSDFLNEVADACDKLNGIEKSDDDDDDEDDPESDDE